MRDETHRRKQQWWREEATDIQDLAWLARWEGTSHSTQSEQNKHIKTFLPWPANKGISSKHDRVVGKKWRKMVHNGVNEYLGERLLGACQVIPLWLHVLISDSTTISTNGLKDCHHRVVSVWTRPSAWKVLPSCDVLSFTTRRRIPFNRPTSNGDNINNGQMRLMQIRDRDGRCLYFVFLVCVCSLSFLSSFSFLPSSRRTYALETTWRP